MFVTVSRSLEFVQSEVNRILHHSSQKAGGATNVAQSMQCIRSVNASLLQQIVNRLDMLQHVLYPRSALFASRAERRLPEASCNAAEVAAVHGASTVGPRNERGREEGARRVRLTSGFDFPSHTDTRTA